MSFAGMSISPTGLRVIDHDLTVYLEIGPGVVLVLKKITVATC